jgi:hypothetical protein
MRRSPVPVVLFFGSAAFAVALLQCVGDVTSSSTVIIQEAGAPADGATTTTPGVDAGTMQGVDSGSTMGTDSGAGADSGTDSGPHLKQAFITSVYTTGQFIADGGVTGVAAADALCNALAAANFPGKTFKAWISTSTTGALTHIGGPTAGPWYVGTTFLADTTILTQGTVLKAEFLTETGHQLPHVGVWTGTDVDGGIGSSTCTDWTSADGMTYGTSGLAAFGVAMDGTWTNSQDDGCDSQQPIYCFEQ